MRNRVMPPIAARPLKRDYSATMLNQWLGSRTPPPPAQLARRLEAAVRNQPAFGSGNLSEPLTMAAVAILEGLGSGDDDTTLGPTAARPVEPTGADHPARATALDLLAADALITYAVEAAAEDCEFFAGRVDAMIERLSCLARKSDAA